MQTHEQGRSGAEPGRVLASATLRAAAMLGWTGRELAEVIGSSESTVSRMASGIRDLPPESKPGQMAALVIRAYRSLDALVGNDETRRLRWMSTYNAALGAIPRELMRTPEGLVRVVIYLDGARALA
jgi:transcriptional regulator with XRE-family HTH domain